MTQEQVMSFIKPIDGEKRWAHPFLEVFQLVKKKIWLLSADLVCYKGNELKKALGSFILSLYPEWFLIAPQVKICQFVIVNLYRKFSVWFNNRQTWGKTTELSCNTASRVYCCICFMTLFCFTSTFHDNALVPNSSICVQPSCLHKDH